MLRRRLTRSFVIIILIIISLANPLLANMKMRKNWNEVPFNSKVQRFEGQVKSLPTEAHLGPGYYEAAGDFDPNNIENKSNAMISQVHFQNYIYLYIYIYIYRTNDLSIK